jgi:hypothetical protein
MKMSSESSSLPAALALFELSRIDMIWGGVTFRFLHRFAWLRVVLMLVRGGGG